MCGFSDNEVLKCDILGSGEVTGPINQLHLFIASLLDIVLAWLKSSQITKKGHVLYVQYLLTSTRTCIHSYHLINTFLIAFYKHDFLITLFPLLVLFC